MAIYDLSEVPILSFKCERISLVILKRISAMIMSIAMINTHSGKKFLKNWL
jgi:hypothetical protein